MTVTLLAAVREAVRHLASRQGRPDLEQRVDDIEAGILDAYRAARWPDPHPARLRLVSSGGRHSRRA